MKAVMFVFLAKAGSGSQSSFPAGMFDEPSQGPL
jgi:hypothetical protein